MSTMIPSTDTNTVTRRVRPLLSAMNAVEKAALKKLLPPKLPAPEEPAGTRYPAALLAQLAVAAPTEQYSLAGIITETLLRSPPAGITTETLLQATHAVCPAFSSVSATKVLKSKTTEPYLEHLRETRKKMRIAGRGDFRVEEEVGTGPVRGHPDLRTDTQVFEIKMTGQLKKNWQDFLYQVFAYAALAPEVTDLYLVLPLQEIVWHYDLKGWVPAKRDAYRSALESAATKKENTKGDAMLLLMTHAIGSHMHKRKSLVDTIHSLPFGRPAQIFLAGPQSSRLLIADEELAAAAAAITTVSASLYIHSPYIINLCTPVTAENDSYHTKLLIKNLQYGAAIGARGVVVHVGKSTTQSLEVALATMKTNLMIAMEYATEGCPILLETPAGQGTEVLTNRVAFTAFLAEIPDPRLQICIDTCHVFAAGEDPLAYVTEVIEHQRERLGLIHFNDSATLCGSCVDRHAFMGEGHVGMPTLSKIADAATAASIHMVIE
jgi:deoxyribonuclease-4